MLAGWLQHLALASNLVRCSQCSLRPEPFPAPLSFCLHLFYIWGPHYVKFLHTANTFNLLPAKFHVTLSDFFSLSVLLVAHILLCTLNFPSFSTVMYRKGLEWRDLSLKEIRSDQIRVSFLELKEASLMLAWSTLVKLQLAKKESKRKAYVHVLTHRHMYMYVGEPWIDSQAVNRS